MSAEIRNLLFDLGGVIMDIRKERCIAAFEELGLNDAASYFGDFCQKGPFKDIERGDITVDEFHQIIRQAISGDVSDEQIDHAFCRFLIGIPPSRLLALEHLATKYRVGLLSNTNSIMWHSKIADDFASLGHDAAYYFPAGIVTSFEANALKPEPKIFRYVVDQLGFKPEETLFFDDSQVNLDAASALGFHTALVAPGTEFIDLIS